MVIDEALKVGERGMGMLMQRPLIGGLLFLMFLGFLVVIFFIFMDMVMKNIFWIAIAIVLVFSVITIVKARFPIKQGNGGTK